MKFAFFLVCITLAVTCIYGQGSSSNGTEKGSTNTTENTTISEIVLTSSGDVSTTFVFPTSAQKKFIIGQPIPLVLGFTNRGDKSFNVTYISASLRYPGDWRYIIQNYTRFIVNTVVPPNEHASFLYNFLPDPMIEPRDFGLQANVYYVDTAGENYTTVYFNSTITLAEPSDGIDAQTLFTYVGILGVAGLIGFFVYKSGGSGKKRSSRSKPVEYGTQKSDVLDNEWLTGTAASKAPKAPRSPTSTKKKN